MPNGLKRFPGPRHPNRARMFWRKLQNKEVVISKPHVGRKSIVRFLIILLVGIFAIDQGLKKPGIASPLLHLDPFTTIWDGRTAGPTQALIDSNAQQASFDFYISVVGRGVGQNLLTAPRTFHLGRITVIIALNVCCVTGSGTVKFYEQGGICSNITPTEVSSSIDLSLLTTSYQTFTFTFSGNILVTSGDCYGFAFFADSGNLNGHSIQMNRSASATHAGNEIECSGTNLSTCFGDPTTSLGGWFIYDNIQAPCAPGYLCLNSTSNANGVIVQTPNATFPAIAISQSPIDLSTGVSKELAFNEQWSGVSGSGPWGWYLTLNKTLPQTALFFPGNDTETALFVEVFRNGSTYIHYVYIQRTGHQAIIPGSGVGSNPFNNCPPNTIFICGQKANTGTTSFESLILNYTGSVSAPGGANGRSKLCVTISSGTSENCDVGGSQQSIITLSGAGVLGNFTLPWLNIQNGPYYLGFWDSAGAQTMNWQNGITDTNQPNVISLFVPIVSAQVPGQIQEGGFFGPLIKALIGLGVWILSNILQYVSFLFTIIVTAFDAVGAFLGIGPIGTQMQRVVAEVATWITNVFAPVIAAALNTVIYIGNFFAVISAVASGYFSFMTGWLSSLTGILGTIITVLQNATSLASYGSSFFIIAWWVWGIFSALRSFDEWLKWCKWSYLGTVSIARISFSFGETVWGIILKAKSLLHPLSSGGGTTGSPV